MLTDLDKFTMLTHIVNFKQNDSELKSTRVIRLGLLRDGNLINLGVPLDTH